MSGIHRLAPQHILAETDPARKQTMIQYLAQESRADVLDTLHAKDTGHWGGASAAAELFAESGDYVPLMAKYGISPAAILVKALKLLVAGPAQMPVVATDHRRSP